MAIGRRAIHTPATRDDAGGRAGRARRGSRSARRAKRRTIDRRAGHCPACRSPLVARRSAIGSHEPSAAADRSVSGTTTCRLQRHDLWSSRRRSDDAREGSGMHERAIEAEDERRRRPSRAPAQAPVRRRAQALLDHELVEYLLALDHPARRHQAAGQAADRTSSAGSGRCCRADAETLAPRRA